MLPGGSPSLQILARKPGSIVAKAFRHPVDQIPRTVRGAREPVAPGAHFHALGSDSRPFNHRDTVHKADRNPQCTKINQAPSRSITNPQSEGQSGRVQARQPEQSPLSRSRRTTRVTGLMALRSKQTLGGLPQTSMSCWQGNLTAQALSGQPPLTSMSVLVGRAKAQITNSFRMWHKAFNYLFKSHFLH